MPRCRSKRWPGLTHWLGDVVEEVTRLVPTQPVRVLLVDDNEAVLTRASAVLTPGCIIVGSAKDGPTALKAAESLQPDVIVLDISMPGMTGLEVAVTAAKGAFDRRGGVPDRP